MYQKITSSNTKEISVGSILASFEGPDAAASQINRATAEHYQVTAINLETKICDLSIPDDEIPDGSIYVNGHPMPVTGIVYNEPIATRSLQNLVEEGCWWLLKQ